MKEKQKKIFYTGFIAIGLFTMQIPFSQLLGVQNLRFSLFDFYGPIAGAFIGSGAGLLTVLGIQAVNWAIHGFALDLGTLLRFLPVLFGVLYFAKSSKWILAVPIIAMIGFWLHPEGRTAWYFALYWTIPLFMHFLRDKYVFARAIGATFTQHSVGGLLWIYAFNMKAVVWVGLVPIVWKERLVMAGGITLTYIAFNYLFSLISEKTKFKIPFVQIHERFRA
ncbi:MAG TPA: hypothetical protein DCY48_04825 [Candidatus Magasanikbacteria bacterium]|nr:MAG: hypothetical protein A3I74_03305 [Candidatus Magasanikbacteria bacterium RIFCSPLOWO2_02_FULL_47_16]OGH80235.1 MAG: hypothetical protein A3C10_03585 [Candidatus Magasanikbacteria bacterium RIFCSPHIGHO2_02_FULL_48_18]OGH82133.1 MAG: hypothetical protein A3G08_02100 [Candidatus Magasanikbacteria bacterium RIFCSPLOWO2_12_FULL_47_9b]HAZ29063.1 hypothetical protein [Candidatus Magasanikbacteria bacterium]